ncbi:hypothetical protein TcWFU_008246 [Taenia crassiceps]|uniref:Uncharacterized protein n=1 Tax=Taenia crassiceps TaxID=6207 RepID=A0ABR4QHQ7_9CEST
MVKCDEYGNFDIIRRSSGAVDALGIRLIWFSGCVPVGSVQFVAFPGHGCRLASRVAPTTLYITGVVRPNQGLLSGACLKASYWNFAC